MNKLPPCPRCKGQPSVKFYRYDCKDHWYVQCGVCRFCTPDAVGKAASSANNARQAWYKLLKDVKTNPKLLKQSRW